jgi:tape measure domain-containing protein
MAITADRVIVELEAKIDRYNANVRTAERSFSDATNRIQRNSNIIEKSVSTAMRGAGAALAGVSALALARQFLSLADASKQMDSQLRLATKTFGTLGQAQADVDRLAAETRSGLVETTALYGNLLRATQTLGGSQTEAARATETFSKALKIGGADTQSAASATLQFGQALASGVLRGDEFNSIAEASPRILQLLADALGKPRSELRALAEDGKLTSDLLFKALTDKRFTAGIDEEFKTLPVTFGDAMQQVENAAITTFGAFDRGGGFSTALANFVTDGADGFGDLEKAAEDLGIETRAILAGLSDVFNPMLEGAKSVFGQIRGEANYARESIANILGLYDTLRNASNSAVNYANDRAGAVTGYKLSGSTGRSDARGTFLQADRRSAAQGRIDQAARRLEGQGYIVPRNADGSVNEAGIRKKVNAPAAPRAAGGGGSKKTGPKGPSAETLAKREEAARLTALRNDEAFESEKYALNQDLLRARRATATAAATIAEFELQEIEAERARQNDSYKRDVSEKKLTQARADELTALNDKVAAERAGLVRAQEEDRQRADRASLAEADLTNARDMADAEGQLATTAKQRRDSALRLLDYEYQLEKLRLENIVAARDSTDAEKEIARRRLAALPGLQATDTEATKRDNEGPLARYRRGMDDPATQVEQAVADKLQQVNEGITDAIADKLGIKDPFLKQMLDLFIQQNIMKPLYDAFSKTQSEGGGVGGFFSSLISAVSGGGGVPSSSSSAASGDFGRASGGYVGAGQMVRVNEGASPGNVEGWRPMGSGHVIPLGQMKATRGGSQTIVHAPQFNLKGAVVTQQLYADMQRISQDSAATAGRTAYGKALQDAPGRLGTYDRLKG